MLRVQDALLIAGVKDIIIFLTNCSRVGIGTASTDPHMGEVYPIYRLGRGLVCLAHGLLLLANLINGVKIRLLH